MSFYKTPDQERMMTSMAQVFNARSDGVVVRGGPARIKTEDRHPHLEQADAERLLLTALRAYRQVHHTRPPRTMPKSWRAFARQFVRRTSTRSTC